MMVHLGTRLDEHDRTHDSTQGTQVESNPCGHEGNGTVSEE